MSSLFDIFGYQLDVYENGKYLGSIDLGDNPDREKMGYDGRKKIRIDGWLYKGKKPQFYASGEYVTECIPLCGKVNGDELDRRYELAKSRKPYNRE